jgi:hypothetical protein
MPFIESKYRHSLDWFITYAESGKVWDSLLGLQKTLDDKYTIPPEQFDGALNYTMCQLYRKSDIVIAESIVLMLFNKYYYDEPRYTKLKDALGTLYSVRKAFRSHMFDSCGINREDDIVSSLDRLIAHQETIYIPYELEKKTLNGDLTY